jgi:hypothetical protein
LAALEIKKAATQKVAAFSCTRPSHCGVPAQTAGRKPSAFAEGYAVLAIDDLRAYAVQMEAYVLRLAGVQFDASAEPGKLHFVAG